jgi:apolipoprotein N-acyltransferase
MSRALALLSGALLVLSFPKFGHPAFAWIAIAPLIVAAAIDASNRGRSARLFGLGVLAGLVYFGGTVYWVVGVMQTFGGLADVVAVLVAALLASYLSIYPGLFALLTGHAVRRFGVRGIWLTPAVWVACEWLRSTIGGGFPWVLLGSSQATVLPIVQLSSVFGVYGLSALIALVSSAAAALTLSRRSEQRRLAIAVALLLLVVAGAGMARVSRGTLTTTGAPLRVGLVQGSIGQAEKYEARLKEPILQRYIDLSRQAIGAGAQLVIWPEASTPFYFDADSASAAPIRRLAVEAHTPFVLGTDEFAPARDGVPDRFFNSAVLVDASGRTSATYRKVHLVPFGEYVPLKRLLFFVGPLIEAVSDFSAGTAPVVFDAGVCRLSVAICYESVYPSVSREFSQAGSELLATITNDAWFGRSSAAYQHFEQGAIRAVEEGRYVVRAANTGISGAVDPYGRVLAKTDLFVPAAIVVDVRRLDGQTIYRQIGDVVAWLALAITAWLGVTTWWHVRAQTRARRIS